MRHLTLYLDIARIVFLLIGFYLEEERIFLVVIVLTAILIGLKCRENDVQLADEGEILYFRDDPPGDERE